MPIESGFSGGLVDDESVPQHLQFSTACKIKNEWASLYGNFELEIESSPVN
jgi:hypothetical protein